MNTRLWILSGVLLAFPALGWSADPAPAAKVEKPTFNLKSAQVQESIRAAARAQSEATPQVAAAPSADAAQPIVLGTQTSIPFRALRRPHHVKCDNIDCVAYTADDVVLYSVPRTQYYGQRMDDGSKSDAWLSCQSQDDLLTTFERYDKCRGVTIGLPLTFGNTVIEVPGLTF